MFNGIDHLLSFLSTTTAFTEHKHAAVCLRPSAISPPRHKPRRASRHSSRRSPRSCIHRWRRYGRGRYSGRAFSSSSCSTSQLLNRAFVSSVTFVPEFAAERNVKEITHSTHPTRKCQRLETQRVWKLEVDRHLRSASSCQDAGGARRER